MKVDPIFSMGMESAVTPISNQYIWSSTNWMLFEAGRVWNRCGRSAPVMARKSKGYSVRIQTHANDWVIQFVGDDLDPELRRL